MCIRFAEKAENLWDLIKLSITINQKMNEPVADPVIVEAYAVIDALPLNERVNAGVKILEKAIHDLNANANKIRRAARRAVTKGKNELRELTSPSSNIRDLDLNAADLRKTGGSFKTSMDAVLAEIRKGTLNADLKDRTDTYHYDNKSVACAREKSFELLGMYSLYVVEKATNAEREFDRVKTLVRGHEDDLFTINEKLQNLTVQIQEQFGDVVDDE